MSSLTECDHLLTDENRRSSKAQGYPPAFVRYVGLHEQFPDNPCNEQAKLRGIPYLLPLCSVFMWSRSLVT